MPHRPEVLARAYAACEALARSHYENFPVASWLLPRPMRAHVAAVYAFARVADDIADEGAAPPAERLAQLNAWQRRLHAAVAIERSADAPHEHEDLIVVALAHSIRVLDLPIALFDDLLSAFGQDTMDDALRLVGRAADYCRRSRIRRPAGAAHRRIPRRRARTIVGCLCTALQLTNFWQDFGRDWRAGPLVCPGESPQRAGRTAGPATALTAAWMAALDLCVAETRRHFAAGRAVCDAVRGRLRYELRLTWLGGARMLEQVERRGATLLTDRPTLGAGDVAAILWRAASWRAHL